MPRRRPAHAEIGRTPNAIVAAASQVTRAASGYGKHQIPKQSWQAEAWRQFEISGELAFAATWMANSLSRCRIYVADLDDSGEVIGECQDAEIKALTTGLTSNRVQQSQMLSKMGVQLFVPGDCYVIAEPNALGVFSKFCTVSIDEISRVGNDKVMIDTGDGEPRTLSTETNIVQRVYHPHPRRSWEATSPVRAVLPTLREIEEYGRYINSIVNSRLAGAGILGIPSEINFPAPPEALQPGETNFSATLAKAMLTPISDLGDPSAVVPITIEAPGDELGKIVWIKNPNGELTSVPAELRADARGTLAVGLDLPAEVIKGEGNANHWGEWAIEEQSIKIHIEPLLLLICSSLTDGFLTPLLEAAGYDPTRYTLWFDSSDLVLRPDRSTDAKDAYDRGELSGEALLRYTGFNEQDAPEGDEEAIRALMKLVSLAPSTADALVPAMAKLLGLDKLGITPDMLMPAAPDPGGTPVQDAGPGREEGDRDIPQAPRRRPSAPVSERSVVASLAVHNALSRAGSMLAGRKAELRDVPKHEVHAELGGIEPRDAARVLAGQFDYLAEVTDEETAMKAYNRAFALLTTGERLV